MKTYQTEVVTVKGIAISVTAGFILDVHRTFMLLDRKMINFRHKGMLEIVMDKSCVKEVKAINDGRSECSSEVVSAWNVMYRLLKTIDSTFTSVFVESVEVLVRESQQPPVPQDHKA